MTHGVEYELEKNYTFPIMRGFFKIQVLSKVENVFFSRQCQTKLEHNR